MQNELFNNLHEKIELTKEQMECLKYTGDKVLMVKGVAGAGKSVVLQALAKKYVDKYGLNSKNKVAIFTYQNTLVSTTKEFLAINGSADEGVSVCTVNSYIKAIYDELVTLGKAPKRSFPLNTKFGEEKRIKNVEMALEQHKSKYGKHRFHELSYEFWLEEFDWMKRRNVWVDDMAHYLTIKRKGRGGNVRMSASDRVTAFQLYVCYCSYLDKTNQGDWADQTLFIIRNASLIPEKYKYEHILIDEAQDLSCAQMLALMTLYKTDMAVAMDMNQRIHSTEWTPKMIGIETTTKKLTRSMRTTVEIDALAECVRKANDEYLGADELSLRSKPEKSGSKPKLIHLDSQPQEKEYVLRLVKKLLNDFPTATIGIIAAKNKQIKVYESWLADEGIFHEVVATKSTFSMASKGVKVVTAFSAKGLEFNFVIIPQFAEGYFPYNHKNDDAEEYETFMFKMRNLVYVSMTRAKNALYITWWGNAGSRFINDMDKSLYDFEGSDFFIKSPKTCRRTESSSDKTLERHIDSSADNINTSVIDTINLKEFLVSKGLKTVDKRPNGGCLWIVGGKEIDPFIKESRTKYGALWTFSERGGGATGHKPGWFTKSAK